MTERQKNIHRPLRARLAEREPRPLDRMKEPIVHDDKFSVRLHRPEEVAAVAAGLLLLRMVEDTGRTRLFERAIDQAFERVTTDLDAEEVMRLEVEAYEIIDWLVGDDAPLETNPEIARREGEKIVYDPDASVMDMLHESLFQSFDVHIAYFTRTRGEVNKRVVSPYAIAAEHYVRAWCHARRAQRVFRIERITRCIPVNGVPMVKADDSAKPPVPSPQLSLLDGLATDESV